MYLKLGFYTLLIIYSFSYITHAWWFTDDHKHQYGPELPPWGVKYNFGSFIAVKEKVTCNDVQLPCFTFDEFFNAFKWVLQQIKLEEEHEKMMGDFQDDYIPIAVF